MGEKCCGAGAAMNRILLVEPQRDAATGPAAPALDLMCNIDGK
jgi:hypothetical protein